MTIPALQVILPKKFLKDAARFERIIENTLDGAALSMQIDFQVTTQTWEHKPRFYIRRKSGERFVGTDHRVYHMLNVGTRPHIIQPKFGRRFGAALMGKRRPRLAFFATGFKPKSRPEMIASYKGRQAGKDFRTPLKVHHPGTQARKWDKRIRDKWQHKLHAIMQRAIDAEI